MRPARGVLVSFRTPSRSRKSPYHAHLSTPFHLPSCERVFIQCHLENGLSSLFLTARAAVMSPPCARDLTRYLFARHPAQLCLLSPSAINRCSPPHRPHFPFILQKHALCRISADGVPEGVPVRLSASI